MIVRNISVSLRSFLNDARGTVTIESLISLPLLLFWLTATFVFFDAYKTLNTQEKASGAVADMLARQQEGVPLTFDYLMGINSVFKFMINNGSDTNIRVTSVGYNGADEKFISLWSNATGGLLPVTTADLNNPGIVEKLPELLPGETYIVVETFTEYEPPFNVGLDAQKRQTFAPTPLRFVNRICWETCS